MTEAQRCGMMCGQPNFQNWLAAKYPADWEFCGGHDPDANRVGVAADVVRDTLDINSRRELDVNADLLKQWQMMLAQFEADTGRMAERTR